MVHAPPPGLGEIDALVHECWSRPVRAQDRALPLIALLGRPGSGKTFALDHFETVTRGAPAARIDFAAADTQRPYEVAVHLAFLLARKHTGIKPLRFPRLLLGLLAVQPELSLTDREQATRELRKALRQARTRGAAVDAGEGITTIVDSLGLSPIPGTDLIIGVLLRGFEYMPTRTFLNQTYHWYGSLGPPTAMDELVELNLRSRSTAEEHREAVDRRLCEAFLADLRAAYAHGRRDHNCLVLLDNIDHSHGTRFLDLLVRLRAEHAVSQPGRYDPLLIVATSATTRAVPGPADGRPGDPYIHPADRASYADWRPRTDAPPADWWYPVRLRDLYEVEVSLEAGRHLEHATRLARATPLVHRLTYGHPWSVQQVHIAIGGLLAAGVSDRDLYGLLDTPVPGDGAVAGRRPPLGAVARDYLLEGLTTDQRAATVPVAAARTPAAAVNSGLLNDLSEHARDTVMLELRNQLWLFAPVPEDANTRGGRGPSGYLAAAGDAEQRPVLHPWLRLLLLEELAGQPGPPGGPTAWQQAHRTLGGWHERLGRPLDALYHRLALDELDAVVAYFAHGFGAPDAVPWLRELYHVTAAPMRRTQLTDAQPSHNAGQLAREHAPAAYADPVTGRPLAELAAALWLAGDPRNRLPPGRPELNYKISAMFRQLALAADADTDTLLDEAARFTD
ncbi:hypothetical protein ABZ721_21970 [Streptomyces sp. NPDC006733]|uniref:hypothetical protein n=1 Tax=Streptomyces sp. NPDC006733 TaxID=3155460 RepID=UPI0033C07246